MKAIGGEWRFNEHHPNFAWGPRETDEFLHKEDLNIKSYTGSVNELKTMLIDSRIASARYSPLRAIMKHLVEQSSK